MSSLTQQPLSASSAWVWMITELVFLPGLLKRLEQQAPKVKLQIVATNWMRSPKLLDTDEIDL